MITSQQMHQLQVFVAIVRYGSMTAAAPHLGISKGVVSIHLRTLEEGLGVRLLERTTRKMSLTQVGERVYESAVRMIEAGEEAIAAADEENQTVSGHLCVSCPVALAEPLMTDVLRLLRHKHPTLSVALEASDVEVDVLGRRLDVAVRVGIPTDSTFVMKSFARTEEILVCSSSLGEACEISSVETLSTLPWVSHTAVHTTRTLTFQHPDGGRETVRMSSPILTVAHVGLVKKFVRDGHGIAVLPRFMVEDELAKGELVQLLAPWYRRQVQLYALMPSRPWPRRTSVFLEAMVEVMAQMSWSDR